MERGREKKRVVGEGSKERKEGRVGKEDDPGNH